MKPGNRNLWEVKAMKSNNGAWMETASGLWSFLGKDWIESSYRLALDLDSVAL